MSNRTRSNIRLKEERDERGEKMLMVMICVLPTIIKIPSEDGADYGYDLC